MLGPWLRPILRLHNIVVRLVLFDREIPSFRFPHSLEIFRSNLRRSMRSITIIFPCIRDGDIVSPIFESGHVDVTRY